MAFLYQQYCAAIPSSSYLQPQMEDVREFLVNVHKRSHKCGLKANPEQTEKCCRGIIGDMKAKKNRLESMDRKAGFKSPRFTHLREELAKFLERPQAAMIDSIIKFGKNELPEVVVDDNNGPTDASSDARAEIVQNGQTASGGASASTETAVSSILFFGIVFFLCVILVY